MFIAISIEDYVPKYLAANRGARREDVVQRLREALEAARAGARCSCGNPIWVVGAADAGLSCFTCITGESTPDGDYEIDEALRV
jgi:hypothetical protein